MDFFSVKLLSEHGRLPTKGSPLSAGYDIYCAHATVVAAMDFGLVKTDISIRPPKGTYARIAPRSSLALKSGINIGAGVIDEDYTGPVGAIVFNNSRVDFKVERGDRVAQIILEKIAHAEVREVQCLQETERGSGGFGSTGI